MSANNDCDVKDIFKHRSSWGTSKKSDADPSKTFERLTRRVRQKKKSSSSPGPAAAQSLSPEIENAVRSAVEKTEYDMFSPATPKGQPRRQCQAVGCRAQAATALRPEKSDTDREPGAHPNTHCFKHAADHAAEVGRPFLPRPCGKQCGNDRNDNVKEARSRKFCDACSVKVCKCCEVEDAKSRSLYCPTCLSENKPGEGIPCSTKDCGNVGLYQDESICPECARGRIKRAKCRRCEKDRELKDVGEGIMGYCTECVDKCIFRNAAGKLCPNEKRANKKGNGQCQRYCDFHSSDSGDIKSIFRAESKASAAKANAEKPWYQCKYCKHYQQSGGKWGAGNMRCKGCNNKQRNLIELHWTPVSAPPPGYKNPYLGSKGKKRKSKK